MHLLRGLASNRVLTVNDKGIIKDDSLRPQKAFRSAGLILVTRVTKGLNSSKLDWKYLLRFEHEFDFASVVAGDMITRSTNAFTAKNAK